jgi:hypothetical protein
LREVGQHSLRLHAVAPETRFGIGVLVGADDLPAIIDVEGGLAIPVQQEAGELDSAGWSLPPKRRPWPP